MVRELIDQLDEDGEFLGVVDKDEAHQKGLWHRAVHVWIVNDKKEILLQYRCHQKKFFPDVWDASFAGHVDTGENPINAVIREGKEELGIDVDVSKLSHLFTIKEQQTYNDIISNEFVDVFLLRDKLEEKIMQHPTIHKQLKKVLIK